MKWLRLVASLAVVGAIAPIGARGYDDRDSSGPSPATVELLSHINPGIGANADVFGYRGYAYLASWRGHFCLSNGVRVYDLEDPRAPAHVSTFADSVSDPTVARTWTEKVIVQHVSTPAFTGDLAVVSFQACFAADLLNPAVFRGFGLYDVTVPARPVKLAVVNTEPGQNAGSHEIWLGAIGNRAYVYTAISFSEIRTSPDGITPGKPDFRIYNVSEPGGPVEVGGWGAWKALGVHPFTGQGASRGSFTHSVITNEQGTRAYLSYWDLGTVILDISNPAHPVFIGRTTFQTSEAGDAHSAAIYRGGNVLIEAHETGRTGVPSFWDISNPARPFRLAEFVPPEASDTVHDARVRGSFAAFSWYSTGVVVADVAEPANPRFLAQFAPPPDYVNPDVCTAPCRMVWGVFIDTNYILVSDINDGLWVIRVTTRPPQPHPRLPEDRL